MVFVNTISWAGWEWRDISVQASDHSTGLSRAVWEGGGQWAKKPWREDECMRMREYNQRTLHFMTFNYAGFKSSEFRNGIKFQLSYNEILTFLDPTAAALHLQTWYDWPVEGYFMLVYRCSPAVSIPMEQHLQGIDYEEVHSAAFIYTLLSHTANRSVIGITSL